MAPSIGNWGMRCQSHYWIKNNQVLWSTPMSKSQIKAVRGRDQRDQSAYIAKVNREKGRGLMGVVNRVLKFFIG